jgi:IS5 family transposase
LSTSLSPVPVAGGRPALPVRLMAGLWHLKQMHNLSDEDACECWLEKPVLAALHRRGFLPVTCPRRPYQ